MTWESITAHWSGILGDTGIIAGLFFSGVGFWREVRTRRAQTLLDLTKSHRDVWTHLQSLPESDELFDSKRDLALRPRTDKETHVVSLLIHHLHGAYYAGSHDIFVLPEKLSADIRNFFSKPVPRDAWDEIKAYHDRDFVAFVEKALRDGR